MSRYHARMIVAAIGFAAAAALAGCGSSGSTSAGSTSSATPSHKGLAVLDPFVSCLRRQGIQVTEPNPIALEKTMESLSAAQRAKVSACRSKLPSGFSLPPGQSPTP